VEAKIHGRWEGPAAAHEGRRQLLPLLNRVILDSGLEVESVGPADDDVNSAVSVSDRGEGSTV